MNLWQQNCEMSSVIFEGWLFVHERYSSKKLFCSHNFWKKRYFVLLRSANIPQFRFYGKKPKDIKKDYAKKVISLDNDSFHVSRKLTFKGKTNVCLLTFDNYDLYLAPKETILADSMMFLIHTLMKLKPEYENQCFVVRLDKSRDNQRLGCQSSCCVLHLSKWGITLALQMSKSLLAHWPIRCIKSFECTGQGRMVINVGHLGSTGPGRFAFRTRIGQDGLIYEALDLLIDELARIDSYNPVGTEVLNQLDISIRSPIIMNDLKGLSNLTKFQDDSSFDQYHKKLAKDLCDYMSAHLGESTLALANTTSVMTNSSRCPSVDLLAPRPNLHENPYKFKPSSSFKLSDPDSFIGCGSGSGECNVGCSADSGLGRETVKDNVFINFDNDDSVSCRRDGNKVSGSMSEIFQNNNIRSNDMHKNTPPNIDDDVNKQLVNAQQYLHMQSPKILQSDHSPLTDSNYEHEMKNVSALYTRPESCISTNNYDVFIDKSSHEGYLNPSSIKDKGISFKNDQNILKPKKPIKKVRKNSSKVDDDMFHYEQCQLDNLIGIGDISYLSNGDVISTAQPQDESAHEIGVLTKNSDTHSSRLQNNIMVGNMRSDDANFDANMIVGSNNNKILLKGISFTENTVAFSKKTSRIDSDTSQNDVFPQLSSSFPTSKDENLCKKKKPKIPSLTKKSN